MEFTAGRINNKTLSRTLKKNVPLHTEKSSMNFVEFNYIWIVIIPTLNGIPYGAKSIRKWKIQSDFS